MRISVVVPVYNEEETIALVLEALARVPLDLEVIVVDDASTDHTWDILQALRQKEPFSAYRYIRHERNQGKGAGLRTGFGLVSGELVTIQDADMEYDPRDLPALVRGWEAARQAGKEKVAIYGRRDLSSQKFTTRWGNRFLTFVTNILFGCRIHDMETCYKLMPGIVARALPMKGRRFEIEPEMTSCILQAGYSIEEVPISYQPRKAKKLSPWRDGWPALAMLLRRRFGKPFRLPATPAAIPSPANDATPTTSASVAEPALVPQAQHPAAHSSKS
ncbi:MAG TPA: glycosyltransferase family 2 protein [Ktedonobacteraceae bacterium]|nr:glycosyltransferase family 2 protein [Ktedonobacteraceae bacterium]